MINSVSPPSLESKFTSLSNSNIIPEIDSLNFNLQNKNSLNSTGKSNTKPKPCTQRIHNQNEPFKEFIQSSQEMNSTSELHICQKQDLLQKRKQYAESIRQKNRCSVKQQKSKKKPHNQTLNLSLSFTPPKDLLISHFQTQSRPIPTQNGNQSFIQNEYYSTKKFTTHKHSSHSKVFAETNMNFCNSTILADSHNNQLQKEGDSLKLSKMGMNTCLELGLSHRQGNHSERRNLNNKENKPQAQHPVSARKNPTQKYTSYAQIFDKKSSMNTLIHTQKSKGAGNTSSRQMSAIKKDKSALKSMAAPEQLLNHEFSARGLYQFETLVNGFALENLSEGLEEMSRIDFCDAKINERQDVNKKEEKEHCQGSSQSMGNQVPNHESCKSRLEIISSTISQTVDFSSQYADRKKQEEKEMVLLAKQNATFKRELAQFRKENSTLRKQFLNSKDYITELQQKAKTLLQQQNHFMAENQKFIEQQNHIECEIKLQGNFPLTEPYPLSIPSHKLTMTSLPSQNSLEQILISTEQELFSLKGSNKALQLKVYMLEKKLVHEEELNKKRLALEVHNWRDKYNKLRNENLKLKNSLNPINNYDLSISMDISRDQ